MKKIVLLILPFLSLISCDKVKHPAQGTHTSSTDTLVAPVVQTNSLVSGTKKVLIEDFTGHFCGNCPRAARRAEIIANTYPNQIIIMANHVSVTYAAPQSDAGLYKEDFRNPDSDAWDLFFGMASKGLPEGAINRTMTPTTYPQGDGAWTGLVASALAQPLAARMDMITRYDTTKHLLNVSVKTKFLQAFSTDIKLCLVLTQDGIVTDQKDYAPPAGAVTVEGDCRPDYLFEHMVLGTLNGTWGQLVKSSPALNDTVTVQVNGYQVTKKCFNKQGTICTNDRKMHLVAFVYREDTKEVLQVETLKIAGDN